MAVTVLGNVGIEQRAAMAAVDIMGLGLLPVDEHLIMPLREADPLERNGSHRLERRACGSPASGAMAIECRRELVRHLIGHGTTQA
jgi:hypothetical protein